MANPPMTDNDIAAVVAAAVQGERERCAKIAEADAEAQGTLGCGPYAATHARSIARAIRSIGQSRA